MSDIGLPDDATLLERAVINARDRRTRKGQYHSRSAAVATVFGIGVAQACELLRRFGLDPEQLVRK